MGYGIFESDASLDFTAHIIEILEKEIESSLYKLVIHDDDFNDADYQGTAALRMLFLILQDSGMYPGFDKDRIYRRWKSDFFAHWEANYLEGNYLTEIPENEKEAHSHRREVIEKTFDDLIELADNWEKLIQEKHKQHNIAKKDE